MAIKQDNAVRIGLSTDTLILFKDDYIDHIKSTLNHINKAKLNVEDFPSPPFTTLLKGHDNGFILIEGKSEDIYELIDVCYKIRNVQRPGVLHLNDKILIFK